jgi:dTMP kinase
MTAKFITFEGIDGAGKSSHVEFVAGWLREKNIAAITTREPGGTPLGETIRQIVLNEKMHGDTEALMVFAARREHLAVLIEPALQRGEWVVCDRFTDSTYAYQCGGRGLNRETVATLETLVHGHRQPDITFLFDAPIETARQRLAANTPNPDKFEREQADFFTRVRDAYLLRARKCPNRIKVIDSSRSMDDIRNDLRAHLQRLLTEASSA